VDIKMMEMEIVLSHLNQSFAIQDL
jgi:hypothetical protein